MRRFVRLIPLLLVLGFSCRSTEIRTEDYKTAYALPTDWAELCGIQVDTPARAYRRLAVTDDWVKEQVRKNAR